MNWRIPTFLEAKCQTLSGCGRDPCCGHSCHLDLNIQHLESLYETIERATGVKVRERIPGPHRAEPINWSTWISPAKTCAAVAGRKGLYYRAVETALAHFFRSVNLEQLRELTLRELAAQIDTRQRDPLGEEIPSSPDQVMVALSSRGPNSEALLRYASRLAGRLNRNWYAVYVQTSKEHPTVIDAATQRILSNTLTLAQQLGATVFTYKGDDIVKTILQFAKEYRVGHIVIGTPGKVPFWKRLRGESSIVERLVTEGTGITVVVLDTKTISHEREIAGLIPSNEGVSRGVEEAEIEGKLSMTLSDAPVFIWDDPLENEQAVKFLIDACCQGGTKRLKEQARKALTAREQQGETFGDDDVLIPHARISGLLKPLVAIGIGKAGIHDSSVIIMSKSYFCCFLPFSRRKTT